MPYDASSMRFQDGALYIGDVSAAELVYRFGTPVYVYDAAVIQRQIDRVKRAFAALPFRPFFAMKANSNPSILRIARESGFGCDAVSPGEIFIAKHAGFTGEEIWFTCSNVSNEDLRAIDDPSIVINVNAMSEIDRVLALKLPNDIALRVNPDVGAGHHRDVITAGESVKFGIDLGEVEQARMVVEDGGGRVVGLHAHIGSGVDNVEPLLQSARVLLDLAPSFPNLRWINFGGGLSVPYKPDEKEFPIEEYGAKLTALAERELRKRNLTAILEPGRYVVAQSGTLIARVTAKRVSGGMTWVGVDTGFNHLVRPSKYNAYHAIVNARASETKDDVIVAGDLCESGDVFTRAPNGEPITRAIDEVRVDDLLAFRDAGAYGFSMASEYNARSLPPEVLVENGEARVIRERGTYQDLLRGVR
jgi:diaminopimelate decarboxylase